MNCRLFGRQYHEGLYQSQYNYQGGRRTTNLREHLRNAQHHGQCHVLIYISIAFFDQV